MNFQMWRDRFKKGMVLAWYNNGSFTSVRKIWREDLYNKIGKLIVSPRIGLFKRNDSCLVQELIVHRYA